LDGGRRGIRTLARQTPTNGLANRPLRPLGYSSKIMGRSMGLEPTNAGATIRCVNHFATTAISSFFIMAGAAGIEPTLTVLETAVLPLNYAPKWWRGTDLNRRTQREQIYSLPRLATSLPLRIVCGISHY
jgi:hypothetical protein